jgi:hypothetical protein
MKVVHLLLIVCVFVIVMTVVYQGDTISSQQKLIREMTHNPQCLISKE